jgi:hypothetical protein
MLRILAAVFVCAVAWAQQPQGRVSQEELPEATPNRQESAPPRGAATRPTSPESAPPQSNATAPATPQNQEPAPAGSAPQDDSPPARHSPSQEEQERGRAGKPVAAFWTVILRR